MPTDCPCMPMHAPFAFAACSGVTICSRLFAGDYAGDYLLVTCWRLFAGSAIACLSYYCLAMPKTFAQCCLMTTFCPCMNYLLLTVCSGVTAGTKLFARDYLMATICWLSDYLLGTICSLSSILIT
eukprot:6211878-Pleurochrysis_carterae.AAC.1